jgi:hypothetical protein
MFQKEKWKLWISSTTLQDSLFLSALVVLSLILYVKDLGFYSDDWSFLGYASMSPDQSYIGTFKAICSPHVLMRPLQLFYFAFLYKLFGTNPLGYHLVNGSVFLCGIVYFYLVLRAFEQPRVLSLAVPAVYALLPHYCTDRFWIAAFNVNLSMTLYSLGLYADLRATQTRGGKLWTWKTLAIVGLLGSTLAYEVFLPLFFINPILVWFHLRRREDYRGSRRWKGVKLVLFLGSNLVSLMAVVVFKALTTVRAGSLDRLNYQIFWFLKLIKKSIKVSYFVYGLGYPARIWQIIQYYFDGKVFNIGIGFGLFVFAYLYYTSRSSEMRLRSQRGLSFYVLFGLFYFLMGYSIFLTNYNAYATPTGIANRVAIAAAVGVAFTFVGGVGWVSSWLCSDRLKKVNFSLLVALLCTSGFLINNTIATFWIRAYNQERAILAKLYQQFPDLPEGSIVLLDGICPYIGPAVVFESRWDLQGALMMHYQDYELGADVITSRTKVKKDSLDISLYNFHTSYPYSNRTFVYHVGYNVAYRLSDVESARRYFQTYNPDLVGECPKGKAGFGVPIF